jgi:hypothetical protein
MSEIVVIIELKTGICSWHMELYWSFFSLVLYNCGSLASYNVGIAKDSLFKLEPEGVSNFSLWYLACID